MTIISLNVGLNPEKTRSNQQYQTSAENKTSDLHKFAAVQKKHSNLLLVRCIPASVSVECIFMSEANSGVISVNHYWSRFFISSHPLFLTLFLFLPFFFSLSILPVEVDPLNAAGGLEKRCKLFQRSQGQPQPKSNWVHYSLKM